MKKRAAFYVDGFNLYHSIDNLKNNSLKWLCLQKLANELVPNRDEYVHSVKYFSAVATHRSPESMLRHRTYIAALQSQGVACILGKFKRQPKGCFACGSRWFNHEEKETDVNIAIQMIDDAYNDMFDVCYVVSADTDLIPPMRLLQSRFPEKTLVAVSPPDRPHGKEIRKIADRSLKLNVNQLSRCQLPDELEYEGRYIIRPDKFK